MSEPIYHPRASHLVVTLFVALFGGVVLWMILHPRIADDYRNYYVDRSWSCFPRLISHHYPLGQPISFVKDRPGYKRDSVRWCGFMPAKVDGIKSFGDYGILKLKFDMPDEDLLLTFSSWANTNAEKPARDVTIAVNGQRLGVITFKDAKRVNGTIIIPQGVAKASPDGMLELRWEVPRIAPAGTNTEPVTLQLRLEAVRIVPLSQSPPPAATPVGEPAARRSDPRWGEKQEGGVAPASSDPSLE